MPKLVAEKELLEEIHKIHELDQNNPSCSLNLKQ